MGSLVGSVACAPTVSLEGGKSDGTGGPQSASTSEPVRVDDPVVESEVSPPPVVGGHLLASRDGSLALVGDADRDLIHVVDLATGTVRHTIALERGDWPMRWAEGADGLAYLTLRGAGDVLTVDTRAGFVTERRPVCPEPRGLAYDPEADVLHVACSGGDLVTLPASGLEPSRRVQLDDDLRDVFLSGESLLVTRFRSAEVLTVSANGTITDRRAPTVRDGFAGALGGPPPPLEAGAAWRTIPLPPGTGPTTAGVGDWLMVHQRFRGGPLPVVPGGGTYYGAASCNGIVLSAVTVVRQGLERDAGGLNAVVLAVDAAVSPDGSFAALAIAGQNPPPDDGFRFRNSVVIVPLDDGALSEARQATCRALVTIPVEGEIVSVVFDPAGRLLAHAREPSELFVVDLAAGTSRVIELSAVPRFDTGHDLFHQSTLGGVACASCHMEAGDDGRTWQFVDVGPRRTPSLRTGLLGTEPFHGSGDLPDLYALMDEVYVRRMVGSAQSFERMDALGRWLATVPPPTPLRRPDDEAVVRGAVLFASAGCVDCHDGPHYSNNETMELGPGRVLQVPVLTGVAHRAPYMHDGRAADLRAAVVDMLAVGRRRVDLGESLVDDLVAYLESL